MPDDQNNQQQPEQQPENTSDQNAPSKYPSRLDDTNLDILRKSQDPRKSRQ